MIRTVLALPFGLTALLAGGATCTDENHTRAAIGRLTASAWRHSLPSAPAGSEESITWVFSKNSTFESVYRSDYIVRRKGSWAAVPGQARLGVLLLRDSAATIRGQPIAQVLCFEFDDGHLELAHRRYEPVDPDGQSRPEVAPVGGSLPETLRSDPAFALWKRMTNAPWRVEATPSIADPDEISFRPDGTYTARYVRGECSYDGSWSLSIHDESAGTASLWIPTNRCDPRRTEIPAVLERPVRIRDDRLFLSETPYVGGDAKDGKHLPRGGPTGGGGEDFESLRKKGSPT